MAAGVPRSVLCAGPVILDVLVRPVTEIPAGQGGATVEEIRATPAGTAAGTAVDLARLGVPVELAGAIGADALGDLLLTLLGGEGVGLAAVQRLDTQQTAATVLPIRPNGERPALHVPGASPWLAASDELDAAIDRCAALHLGAPELFRDRTLPEAMLRRARVAGAITTVDLLAGAPGRAAARLRPLLPFVDVFAPNDAQLCDLYGTGDDVVAAAAAALADGAGAVAVSLGGDGCYVAIGDGRRVHLPAFAAEVVDTTGCGDALCAGLLLGLLDGADVVEAARLGVATATLVAEGLGSDAGLVPGFDPATVVRDRPVVPPTRRLA